jgi:hypothetical protein
MATAAARATLPRPLLSPTTSSVCQPVVGSAFDCHREHAVSPLRSSPHAIVPVSAVEGLVPVMLKKKPID